MTPNFTFSTFSDNAGRVLVERGALHRCPTCKALTLPGQDFEDHLEWHRSEPVRTMLGSVGL